MLHAHFTCCNIAIKVLPLLLSKNSLQQIEVIFMLAYMRSIIINKNKNRRLQYNPKSHINTNCVYFEAN